MKRLLVLVLATALVAVSLVGCTPNSTSGTMIVGSPAISGDFIYGFGNSSYDKWVKDLTGGFMGTHYVTADGAYAVNETVVKDLKIDKDADGNKTYTYELQQDLKWNDGEPITAKDYVFTLLWEASPEWAGAGATSSNGDGLVGYEAYHEGDSKVFAGVKLIEDYKFSVTIDAEQLPYFYEVEYGSCRPLPMHAWTVKAAIESDENGSQLTTTAETEEWTLKYGTKRISQTERFAPTVTCGPYNFVSFENNAVTLKANPEFKGDWAGKKPQLEFVIIKYINQDTDVDQVINGSVDAVVGVIEAEKIEKARNDANTKFTDYPRNGYGGVFFHCDFSPTNDPNVRKALAYLMDRDEILKNVIGGYGSTVNGMYGFAQWMYKDNKEAIDNLPNLVLNQDYANDLLDETEWVYDKDGNAFDRSKATKDGGYFRYNKEGKPLVVEHLGSEDNNVTDNVEIQWKANCPYAGIDFRLTRCDFSKLLKHYYGGFDLGAERQYNSFNLATGFTATFDPYYDYHSKFYHQMYMQTEQLKDDRMDEITVRMRRYEPEQKQEYSAAWLEFQQLWNELLPVIPLYSNQYHDIYRGKLSGFNTNPYHDWTDIICQISKTK
ncbi:MAG TPA: ABC transporter substrate-binding protein [Firmicutes bacterium]|nr:ABC transporter substrate-binding protein [Bacillota bacterium]